MKLSPQILLIIFSIFISQGQILAVNPDSEMNQEKQVVREFFATKPTEANPKSQTTNVDRENPEETENSENIERSDVESNSSRSTDPDTGEEESANTKPTPEEIARQAKLAQADRLYLAGKKAAAAKLYQQVKQPWNLEELNNKLEEMPAAIYDPAKLNPGGAVYWRIYQQGRQEELESKIFVPLQLLVQKYPEFIPGHLHYAEALTEYEQSEKARSILAQAINQYPNEPDLLRAKMKADINNKEWLDASITARQFALFNPDHPQAEEFRQLADEYLEGYKDYLRSQLTANAVGSVITGALGYAVTGSLFGPFSALETSIMLLRGESNIGDRLSERVQKQLPMVEDEAILNYVRQVGKKIASVSGRDDFEYEFYVIKDDNLNAFALPGGKVFVNLGAIMKTNSEAELAGLLAHEISHAVLSHGFQLVTKGNLTANVAQFIPYVGGTAGNLIVLNYSRDMERQADIYGTRILVAAGYAADGVRNLMVTLDEESKKDEDRLHPPAWLSTHPDIEERVSYLESLITSNKFNRYAYEGVIKHQKIQKKAVKIWKEYQKTEEYRQQQEAEEF
jgi:predicted Zn-dependent protease